VKGLTTVQRHPFIRTIALAALLAGAATPAASQTAVDEFFIVSSVNPPKQQVVVKRPTEVTQLVFVNAETRYADRNGKAIALSDLHAGDTVYIREKRDSGGSIAIEIRKGPMTLDELRKRYLHTKE